VSCACIALQPVPYRCFLGTTSDRKSGCARRRCSLHHEFPPLDIASSTLRVPLRHQHCAGNIELPASNLELAVDDTSHMKSAPPVATPQPSIISKAVMFRYRIMYRYCSYRYNPGTIEKCGIMRNGRALECTAAAEYLKPRCSARQDSRPSQAQCTAPERLCSERHAD
jgi:hypothetical protein